MIFISQLLVPLRQVPRTLSPQRSPPNRGKRVHQKSRASLKRCIARAAKIRAGGSEFSDSTRRGDQTLPHESRVQEIFSRSNKSALGSRSFPTAFARAAHVGSRCSSSTEQAMCQDEVNHVTAPNPPNAAAGVLLHSRERPHRKEPQVHLTPSPGCLHRRGCYRSLRQFFWRSHPVQSRPAAYHSCLQHCKQHRAHSHSQESADLRGCLTCVRVG